MKQKILDIITKKLNDEHDEHSDLVSKIKERSIDDKLLDYLVVVYKARIKILEDLYDTVKRI